MKRLFVVFIVSISALSCNQMKQSGSSNENANINIDSVSDSIIIDCQGGTVIPFGRSKLLTITDVEVNEKMVTLSYKLESEMNENPVLIANYTEGNIACGTRTFHYYSEEITSNRYTMTKNKIKIECAPDNFVSGSVLVRIFFCDGQNTDTPIMAISNVASLRMDF